MLSLVSMASKAVGLHEYIKREKGAEDPLANTRFAQGDVVTTIIRCAGGETITLTLDTTLPRPYSRGFIVSGTKGCYEEDNNSLYLDCDKDKYEGGEFQWKKNWNNAEAYGKTYDHPLWQGFEMDEATKEASHGGMDYLLFRAFFESASAKVDTPIDVYDTASWMCISALSEESVAMGGMPVPIPDFTRGKWIKMRPQKLIEKYRLDKIPEV